MQINNSLFYSNFQTTQVMSCTKASVGSGYLAQQCQFLDALIEDYRQTNYSSAFFEENPMYKNMGLRFVKGLLSTLKEPQISELMLEKWLKGSVSLTIRRFAADTPRTFFADCRRILTEHKDDRFPLLKKTLLAHPFCIFRSLSVMPTLREVFEHLRDTPIVFNAKQTVYGHQLRQYFGNRALHHRLGWELMRRQPLMEQLKKISYSVRVKLSENLVVNAYYVERHKDDFQFLVHSTSLLRIPHVLKSDPISWISASLFSPSTYFYEGANSSPYPVALIVDVDPKNIILTSCEDAYTPIEANGSDTKEIFADKARRNTILSDFTNSAHKLDSFSHRQPTPFLSTEELLKKTATLNEILVLGSLAKNEMSTPYRFIGAMINEIYWETILEEKNEEVVAYIKKLVDASIPIIIVCGLVQPNHHNLSQKYHMLLTKLQTELDKLETCTQAEYPHVCKNIEYCVEVMHEFEHEFIRRKPFDTMMWLANDQLKGLYKHFSALFKQTTCESEKTKLMHRMNNVRRMDQTLRSYNVHAYRLEEAANHLDKKNYAQGITIINRALDIFNKVIVEHNPLGSPLGSGLTS